MKFTTTLKHASLASAILLSIQTSLIAVASAETIAPTPAVTAISGSELAYSFDFADIALPAADISGLAPQQDLGANSNTGLALLSSTNGVQITSKRAALFQTDAASKLNPVGLGNRQPFAIELFVKPLSLRAGTTDVLLALTAGGIPNLKISKRGRDLIFATRISAQRSTTTTVSNFFRQVQDTQVAISYDGVTLRLLRNGLVLKSFRLRPNGWKQNARLILANDSIAGRQGFLGEILALHIYRGAVSAQQLRTSSQAGARRGGRGRSSNSSSTQGVTSSNSTSSGNPSSASSSSSSATSSSVSSSASSSSSDNLPVDSNGLLDLGCSDGIDNDANGATDSADFNCRVWQQERPENLGFSRFTPSADTRLIYVSSSEGDDSNDGSFEHPLRTILAGFFRVRNGYPDWLLLKRGDTWTTELFGEYGGWNRSGRSAAEPIVIGAYGTGARPKYLTLSSILNIPTGINNLAIVGIHFESLPRLNWWDGGPGFSFVGNHSNILVEDCYIRGFAGNLNLSELYPNDIIDNFRIRRNVILDAWSSMSHAQGIYSSHTRGLLIEENILHHNGWVDNTVFRGNSLDVGLTTATYDATTQRLRQPGAFDSSRYPQWSSGDTIYISKGLFASGAIASATSTNVFRGDSSFSPIDGFYVGKKLRFTSGPNSVDSQGNPTEHFKRITNYVGATREFTVINIGNQGDYTLPQTGDAMRVDVIGYYEVAQKISSDEIELASPLSPFDLSSGDINSGKGWAATIYNRNMYLSDGEGDTITRGNIDADGASGGIQQRRGGISERNLIINAPVALTFGHRQNRPFDAVSGTIQDNVILGSRDISSYEPRGFGIGLEGRNNQDGRNGSPQCTTPLINTAVVNNIITSNRLGTSNLYGIDTGDCFSGVLIQGNIVYDWSHSSGPGTAFHKASGLNLFNQVQVRQNNFLQPQRGTIAQLDDAFVSPQLTFEMNNYFVSLLQPLSNWFYLNYNGQSFAQWLVSANDQGSLSTNVNFPEPSRNIESYMAAQELPASYSEYLSRVRSLSKTNWDTRLLAVPVINHIRQGFGMPPL